MSAASPVTTIVPNGDEIYLSYPYTSGQVQGVSVLVAISCISLVAIVGLLAIISISAFNTRSSLDQHLFVRTHVAAYFISLLCCDLAQAIGSIMNAQWIQNMGVEVGMVCTIQGILKQTSDVGTALWTMIIAVHTFILLVLEVKLGRRALLSCLLGGWLLIGLIVVAGSAAQDTNSRGPFFGISGYWCWISPTFPGARITLDYMIMFMAAFFSFILYSLMYMRLRGNLKMTGRRMRFSWKGVSNNTGIDDKQAVKIARQMLLYPLAYTILVLPIAASRFSVWAGHPVPFEVTIFSAAVFLCSGPVNVALFAATRNVLPADSIRISISKSSISKPSAVVIPSYLEAGQADPYYGEGKMVEVDLHSAKLSEKAHTRSTSASSHSTNLSSDIIPPMQHSNRMSYNVDMPYGGADVPQDVRQSTATFVPNLTLPQHPPALVISENTRRMSEAESMYDFYDDRRTTVGTMASYYQYSPDSEEVPDFPAELQRRATDAQNKTGP